MQTRKLFWSIARLGRSLECGHHRTLGSQARDVDMTARERFDGPGAGAADVPKGWGSRGEEECDRLYTGNGGRDERPIVGGRGEEEEEEEEGGHPEGVKNSGRQADCFQGLG